MKGRETAKRSQCQEKPCALEVIFTSHWCPVCYLQVCLMTLKWLGQCLNIWPSLVSFLCNRHSLPDCTGDYATLSLSASCRHLDTLLQAIGDPIVSLRVSLLCFEHCCICGPLLNGWSWSPGIVCMPWYSLLHVANPYVALQHNTEKLTDDMQHVNCKGDCSANLWVSFRTQWLPRFSSGTCLYETRVVYQWQCWTWF